MALHAEQSASAWPGVPLPLPTRSHPHSHPTPTVVRWPSPRRPSAHCRPVANQRRGAGPLAAIHSGVPFPESHLLGFQPWKCLLGIEPSGVWAVGRPHLCTPPATQVWPLPTPTSGTITCLIHSHAPPQLIPQQVTPAAPTKSWACATSQGPSAHPAPFTGRPETRPH